MEEHDVATELAVIEQVDKSGHCLGGVDRIDQQPLARGTGTYARLIEHYVEQKKALSLAEAVRKSSSLPAAAMGFTDRGIVRVGAKADLLLFDPQKVRAKSDYLKPYELAQGFDIVIVNGRVARENGVTASGRYGQVLRNVPTPAISK